MTHITNLGASTPLLEGGKSLRIPIKSPRAAPAEQPVALSLLPTAMLKVPTAALVSGLSVATIYRRAKDDPTFPRLHRLGPRCTRIRAGELDAWLSAHAAERPADTAAHK